MAKEEGKAPAITGVTQTLDLAFVLSLIGGILITLGSVVGMGLVAMGRPFFWGMGGMMGYYNYPYMMGGYQYGSYSYYGMMYGFESLGLIAGILVIVFALLVRSRPSDRRIFGALVLVFSLISFAGMGGFFIGALLGVIGGVLALTSS